MNTIGIRCLVLCAAIVVGCATHYSDVQDGEEERRSVTLRRSVQRYADRNGTFAGTITLFPKRRTLSVRPQHERENLTLDLRQLIGGSFQPLSFRAIDHQRVVIAGFMEDSGEGTLHELGWPKNIGLEQDPSIRVLQRGMEFERPVAIALLPGEEANVVVLDSKLQEVIVWERANGTLHILVNAHSVPALAHMGFLRAEASSSLSTSKGYTVTACSVSAEGEGVPMLSKPMYVVITDVDADFEADTVVSPSDN